MLSGLYSVCVVGWLDIVVVVVVSKVRKNTNGRRRKNQPKPSRILLLQLPVDILSVVTTILLLQYLIAPLLQKTVFFYLITSRRIPIYIILLSTPIHTSMHSKCQLLAQSHAKHLDCFKCVFHLDFFEFQRSRVRRANIRPRA